ncbi:MAG: hypothetical protein WC356_01975 [Candidatus Micrarchaeia archaeon]|jgi:hypothetical protein
MADNYSEITVEKTSAERNAIKQMGISGTTTANTNSEELKVKVIPQTE